MDKYQHVLSPIKIGNVEIKNRIEFAPAIPFLASPDGYVTRELIEWEQSLARGGAGIVTIGDSAIDFDYAHDHPSQLNLGTDEVIPGLSMLVETIQRYGAKASIEINHGGRNVQPWLIGGKQPIAPSPIPSKILEIISREKGGKKFHIQEMNQDLIDQVIDNFASACYRCLQAGFEMVMIHGGHGHLLAQFASPYSNRRSDGYGGSLENRAKFPIEVLTAIRKKVGNKLAIEYRISGDELVPGGMHIEETIEFLKMIEDKIDLVHISAGIIGDPQTDAFLGGRSIYMPPMYNVERAEKIKKGVRIPVAVVGAIKNLEMADKIIAEGKADIAAMASALIADPEIVNKTQRGELDNIRHCLRCTSCNDRTRRFLPPRCAVNPVAFREVEYSHVQPAEKKKKVVIVGGGPAGMEAAQVASSRGHQVTLYEKEEKLGGTLILASAPPFKAEMKNYLDWMIKTTERQPVEIKLSTEATADTVKAEKPDVLIVAVGAVPQTPDIPGSQKPIVVWAGDVEKGSAKVGKTVVVVGAGMTGCETALHLTQQGKKVTLIDMLTESEIAQDTPFIARVTLMLVLRKYNVEIKTEVKLEEVTDRGALVIDKQWRRYEIPADTVVFAMGFKARTETVKSLQGLAREVYVIGDCAKPRNLMSAIHDAFNVAVEI